METSKDEKQKRQRTKAKGNEQMAQRGNRLIKQKPSKKKSKTLRTCKCHQKMSICTN